MRLRGPSSREMFSPGFLAGVDANRYANWRRDGDLLHYTDHTDTHWVWKLGDPDPRKLGYTLGVWPD